MVVLDMYESKTTTYVNCCDSIVGGILHKQSTYSHECQEDNITYAQLFVLKTVRECINIHICLFSYNKEMRCVSTMVIF